MIPSVFTIDSVEFNFYSDTFDYINPKYLTGGYEIHYFILEPSDISKVYPIRKGQYLVKLSDGGLVTALGDLNKLVPINNVREHFRRVANVVYSSQYKFTDKSYQVIDDFISKFDEIYQNILVFFDKIQVMNFWNKVRPVENLIPDYAVLFNFLTREKQDSSFIHEIYLGNVVKEDYNAEYVVLLYYVFSDLFNVRFIFARDDVLGLFEDFLPVEYLEADVNWENYIVADDIASVLIDEIEGKVKQKPPRARKERVTQSVINLASEYCTSVLREDSDTLEQFYNVFETSKGDTETFQKSVKYTVSGSSDISKIITFSVKDLQGFKYVEEFYNEVIV